MNKSHPSSSVAPVPPYSIVSMMAVLLLSIIVGTTEANTFNCPLGDLTSAVSTEINVGLGGTVQCTEAQLLEIGNAVDHAFNPAIAGTVLEESFEFFVHVSADPTNGGSRRLDEGAIVRPTSNLRPAASHRQLSYGGFSYSGGGHCRHCQPDPDCCNRREEETSVAEETDNLDKDGHRQLEAFDPTELADLQTTIGSAIKAHLEATLVADNNSCIYQEMIDVAVTLTEE